MTLLKNANEAISGQTLFTRVLLEKTLPRLHYFTGQRAPAVRLLPHPFTKPSSKYDFELQL
jgi:hypothetical protein